MIPVIRRQASGVGRPRGAFTLIELLVSILIISILAGLLVGVSAVAAESGREARTKQMITRMHVQMVEQYDTYRDRRVPIDEAPVPGTVVPRCVSNLRQIGINVTNYAGASDTQRAVWLAQARLMGAREQMKMEMPDRWSDIALEPIPDDLTDRSLEPLRPNFLATQPTLAQVFWQRYNQIAQSLIAKANADTSDDLELEDTGPLLRENQGAECLYMLVALGSSDDQARTLFGESEVGDTDGDGAPEFLDGWGNPIGFFRWAPGFASESQLSFTRLEEIGREIEVDQNNRSRNEPELSAEQKMIVAIDADRDQLDLFYFDKPFAEDNPFGGDELRGWRLMPLIYSVGSDEAAGMADDPLFVNSVNDPYFDSDPSPGNRVGLGEATDEAITDNLTNHLLAAE